MKVGIYPGSFDPFTSGHRDVLLHASSLFDQVYVSVLMNSLKNPIFTVEQRKEMIQTVVDADNLTNVTVSSFDGLLVEYARGIGAGHIIRGLRAITDFEYEFQIDAVNSYLAPEIKTVYFMASPEHSFLSSSIIREIGTFGADISRLVPDCIQNIIAERLAKP